MIKSKFIQMDYWKIPVLKNPGFCLLRQSLLSSGAVSPKQGKVDQKLPPVKSLQATILALLTPHYLNQTPSMVSLIRNK